MNGSLKPAGLALLAALLASPAVALAQPASQTTPNAPVASNASKTAVPEQKTEAEDNDRDVSPLVRNAQDALIKMGMHVRADGIMGPQTRDAIKKFQAERGIAVSGRLDSATRHALKV